MNPVDDFFKQVSQPNLEEEREAGQNMARDQSWTLDQPSLI